MKTNSVFLAFVASSILFGCASADMERISRSMYNVKETGVSQFDGTKFVQMKNIACPGKQQGIFLDLYQNSHLAQENIAVLTVKVKGYNSIGSGKSLHFNIDGEFIDMGAVDATSEVEEVFPSLYAPGYAGGGVYVAPVYEPATMATTKRYTISEQAIDKIGHAKKVIVKVDLERTYAEGVCNPPKPEEIKGYEWARELSGTEGFKGFAEMTKTLN